MIADAWAVDFEFGPGSIPRCLVARSLRYGTLVRVWEDPLLGLAAPPFPTGPDVALVAYYASAELGCFQVLGWPRPAHCIDLFAEFRVATNDGTPRPNSLLGALDYFGLPSLAAAEKDAMRNLAIRGGPWQPGEPTALLDYCQTDVDALVALWPRLSGRLDWPAFGSATTTRAWDEALFRGAYMMAAAVVEARGVPLDVETLTALRGAWPALKGEVLRAANATYGFWDEALRFKLARFEAWLADRGHAWPRTRTGRPALDEDVLHSMTRAIPALHEFREVRHAVNRLRLERLAVDPDGRNRVLLSAFRTTTGRNAPKASQFIFGPARWLRHLIVAPPGRALAYVDWGAQEHGVMAALSNDPGLLDDYQHGDPYLRMAARFGHAPPDATKATHGEIRERFKVVVLATSYGMGAATLATRLQVPRATAQALLDAHRQLYRVFWSWSDGVVDLGRLRHRLATPFGWRLAVRPHESDRTLRNWPVQATAADMMRLALVRVIEAGIGVGAVIHDAFLIEAETAEIDTAVATTRALMAAASTQTLFGRLTLRTDATIVRPGERYQEPRGAGMWQRALAVLAASDTPTGTGSDREEEPAWSGH